jgi:hypothetical protein
MRLTLSLCALALLGSATAHAAAMSKAAYPTAMMAAKAEAARRFDADSNTRNNLGKTGRKGLSATRTGSNTFKVSYAGAWAGTSVTNVRIVKRADGYHAYKAMKITVEDL